MTPSQEAKTFAAANGFMIKPVERRYHVMRAGMPLVFVADVGGYPAALNAMRAHLLDIEASDIAAFNNPEDAKLMHCDVVREDGAMGVFADAPIGVEMCAGGTLVLPEPSADPALTATANNCFGTLEPITPDTVPMSREEMFQPVKAELDRLKQRGVDEHAQRVMLAQSNATFGKMAPSWAHKTADEIKADIVAGIEMFPQQSRDYNDLEYGTGDTLDAVAKRMGRDERAAGMSDREYRNLLIYGDKRGMPGVDFPMPLLKLSDFVPERLTNYELDKAAMREYINADFNDFNAAAQARIRNAASRIAKHARKLSGKPPGGPWHVIFNGSTVMKYGYPSRAEAIAVVRWGFNHADPRINDNWRTAAVTVEYRA